jgi:hypothetical protein
MLGFVHANTGQFEDNFGQEDSVLACWIDYA